MKIVEILEDLYNIHGRLLNDYAWLTAEKIETYKYASKGDYFIYDEVNECYVNHNSSIPKHVIEEAKHKVSNILELLYQMEDVAKNRYDISCLRGEPLRHFIELDVDNLIIGEIDTMSGDGEVGVTLELNSNIFNFWWVGAEPLGHFQYFNDSEDARDEAKMFILDARIDLIQNLIERSV